MFGCGDPGITESPAGVASGSSRLSELLGVSADARFPRALETREFTFPADHGAHLLYRNEWWYFTGNLDGPNDGRFGFELTFFRFALDPETPAGAGSRWRTNQVYIGHFAVTDVSGEAFHVAQRYSRGSMGLAGADPMPFRVWLDDWVVGGTTGNGEGHPWRLSASDGDVALELELVPEKPIVLNGDGGLSQKSAEAGNASYYYSIPRLASSGTLRLGGRSIDVSGTAWLDREWGSSALSREQRGWDWFALQLSDGSDLMFYTLRRADGSIDPYSSGTLTDRHGNVTHLGREDVEIEVTGSWESERGGRYPSGWRLTVPGQALALEVTPVLEDQELVTSVRYWEGAVDVRGQSGASAVEGRGYVELTGYADSPEARP